MEEEQYNSALDIVTSCAEPGAVVVGFAAKTADGTAELVTQKASDLLAEQAAKGMARTGGRSNAGGMTADSGRAPVGWIEEGERPSRDEHEGTVD